MSRDDIQHLLASTEGEGPVDKRDRAILMLLIGYGLRAGEVCGLQLADLDWQEETLRVRRSKSRRTDLYPLSRGVGHAIVRYLVDVRPRWPGRFLFLTLRAPIRPLRTSALSEIAGRRLDRLGLVVKRRGAHVLRHAAAQHLLDQGLPMKTVGDYLGHRRLGVHIGVCKGPSQGPSRGCRGLRSGGSGMTTLREAIDHYIAWQRTHGTKFVSGAYLLNSFCRDFDQEIECDAVTEAQVGVFPRRKRTADPVPCDPVRCPRRILPLRDQPDDMRRARPCRTTNRHGRGRRRPTSIPMRS